MIGVPGYRVLVKAEKFDDVDPVYASAKKAGIEFALDPKTRYQESVDKGVVVEIGPECWEGKAAWCKIGDTIVYARASGKRVEDPEDKESVYIIMNDDDVICVVRG